jgi:acyl-CoA synthetase (NDP forming)
LTEKRLRGMESFFTPKSIAVAGVSTDPDKLGSIIFANLLDNRRRGLLKARVYALNPAHAQIGDEPCYPNLASLPERPELLIVAVPASLSLELMRRAADAGVRAAVLITGGYSEAGRGDVEKEIGSLAAEHGMRVLGPNTIGLVDTWSGVDSLFIRTTKALPDGSKVVSALKPLKGEVVIITQSGHLGETVSEELAAEGIGVRAIVGTGNQLDVSVEDVVRYFAFDPHTRVIAIYLEGVRDGRQFIHATALASKRKPVVVFKVGKTGTGARAALTHTASLVGNYEAYRAAFRQAGAIEANSLEELVDDTVSMLMLPKTTGRRVAIVTNAGGVGAMAADEADRVGLLVEPLKQGKQEELRAEFGGSGFVSNASFRNPFDLTASVSSEEFARVTERVLALPDYDRVVVLPTHQAPGMAYDIATRVGEAVRRAKKPATVCVIGRSDLSRRIKRDLMAEGVPSFPTPERGVRALAVAADYAEVRKGVEELPILRGVPRRGRSKGGPLPPSVVSKLLRSHGISEPRSAVVRSPKDITGLRRLDYPVACKLMAKGLVHKSDVGGVILGVRGPAEAGIAAERLRKIARRKGMRFEGVHVQEMVEGGVELLLGGMRDPTFGPLAVLGVGGTLTELIGEYVLAVAPVSPRGARSMLARTRLLRILEGYRGGPKVDLARLCRGVSDFSKIMAEYPYIEELEVNPLVAKGGRLIAVDARVVASSGK